MLKLELLMHFELGPFSGKTIRVFVRLKVIHLIFYFFLFGELVGHTSVKWFEGRKEYGHKTVLSRFVPHTGPLSVPVLPSHTYPCLMRPTSPLLESLVLVDRPFNRFPSIQRDTRHRF